MTKLSDDIHELIAELADNLDIDISNSNHLIALREAQKGIISIFHNQSSYKVSHEELRSFIIKEYYQSDERATLLAEDMLNQYFILRKG